MYKLKFYDVVEIRMGSEFNLAKLEITGSYVPPGLDAGFQDIFLMSSDNKLCYLVEWAIDNVNEPGFLIWKLNSDLKTVEKSNRIAGCCKQLDLEEDQLKANVFLVDTKGVPKTEITKVVFA